MLDALLDAADQLTPEQRDQLADRFESFAEHRDWRGRGPELMRGETPIGAERGQAPGDRTGGGAGGENQR